MFGFGLKRVRNIATRLGKTMVIVRDACREADFQALANVVQSHGYIRIEVDSSNHGPIAGWTAGPPETADIVYFVGSDLDVDGRKIFQVTAEGSGKLAGLILIGGVGDVHVEVSDMLRGIGELGADTLAVRRELLTFPGFTSMDQLIASVSTSRTDR